MKAKVIYNPKSGKRLLQLQMSYVVEQLSGVGYRNVEIYPTRGLGDASEAARSARLAGYDLIVAAGGDGTVSEIVNGMTSFGATEELLAKPCPLLGYIPSGTSNDFASSLGIPCDLKKALGIITKGVRARIDIGRLNHEQSFNYIFAAGAFTKLTYTTPHELKRSLGVLAYLKDILNEIPLIRQPFNLELVVDNEEISGDFVIALIINSPSFAGMRKVLPGACMDDGLFDILLLPKSTPKVFFSAIRGMTLGIDSSITESGIRYLSGRNIVINSEKPLAWNIDGEFADKGQTVAIDCQERCLEIMVPPSSVGNVLQHQSNNNHYM